MTIDTLREFGINIEKNENEFIVRGEDNYISPKEYTVEGDWSNSAFFMVLGALGGRTVIKNLNLNSSQSDKMILDVLSLAGVKYTASDNEIIVEKSEIKPFDFDVSQCPDLFPVLSI